MRNFLLDLMQKYKTTDNFQYKIDFNPEFLHEVEEILKSEKEKTTLLCSVRGANKKDLKNIEEKRSFLWAHDIESYFPNSHNNQKDLYKGLLICNTMAFMIRILDNVTVIHTNKSGGTAFDAGVTESFDKKIHLLEHENDEPFLNYLKIKSGKEADDSFYRHIQLMKNYIRKNDNIQFEFKHDGIGPIKDSLFGFGLIYGELKKHPSKQFTILNREELKDISALQSKQDPPILKSYTKVALILEDLHNGMHIGDILKQQYLLT